MQAQPDVAKKPGQWENVPVNIKNSDCITERGEAAKSISFTKFEKKWDLCLITFGDDDCNTPRHGQDITLIPGSKPDTGTFTSKC